MKDYNLNISINTLLKNNGIIKLNKEVQETANSVSHFSKKVAQLSNNFLNISTFAWQMKDKFSGIFGNFISEADELNSSMTGLKSIVNWTWNDFKKAEDFINEFTKDWLVPVWDAATSLKNLLARGFWLEEAKQIMDRFKDSAAFWRQAWLSLWDAIKWATEWLKNENSVLVDNAWVTKNVAKMWEDYAKKIWVSVKNLTMEQKREAELQGILEETKFQVWDAAKLTEEYWWKKAKLDATIKKLNQTIWAVFLPILKDIVWAITPVVEKIWELIKEYPNLSKWILVIVWWLGWLLVAIASVSAFLPFISGWIKAFTTSLKFLSKALLFLTTNPIWLVITAIWLLIAWWIALYQNWDYVKQKLWELWDFFIECWNWIVDFFKEIGVVLIEIWKEIWDMLPVQVQLAFDWIFNILSACWEYIKNIFQTAFDLIVWIWKAFWALFNWDWQAAFNILIETWNNFWENIKNIFQSFLNIIWEIVKVWISFIVSIFSDSFGNIKKITSVIWEWIKTFSLNIWNWLKSWLSEIWNWISESATSIFTGIADSITWIFKGAIDFVKEAWENIKWIWNWVTWASDDIDKKVTSASNKANSNTNISATWWRAYGWTAWKSYIVWERWPEIFTPALNWNITPNNAIWWNTININMWWVIVKTEADEIRLIEKMKTELTRTLQLNKRGIL